METSSKTSERLQALLQAFGPNAGLVEELLLEYLANPAAVSKSWQRYFSDALDGNGGQPRAPEKTETPHPSAAPPPKPAPPPATPLNGAETATVLKGVAAKIVENMEGSLTLPTATSVRTVPVKVLEENMVRSDLSQPASPQRKKQHGGREQIGACRRADVQRSAERTPQAKVAGRCNSPTPCSIELCQFSR